MKAKMTLQDLKSFWPPLLPSGIKGSPDERTRATRKNHIHKHKLSKGERSHLAYIKSKKGE